MSRLKHIAISLKKPFHKLQIYRLRAHWKYHKTVQNPKIKKSTEIQCLPRIWITFQRDFLKEKSCRCCQCCQCCHYCHCCHCYLCIFRIPQVFLRHHWWLWSITLKVDQTCFPSRDEGMLIVGSERKQRKLKLWEMQKCWRRV